MKYERGTKLKHNDDYIYYLDEFYNEKEDQLILVCGGGCGHLVYALDDDVEVVESSSEDKMINILADIAMSIKNLNDNIDDVKEMLIGECECEECSECDPEETELN